MELNKDNTKLLVTEIGIMKTSTHPNIVAYYDTFLVGSKLWVPSILTLPNVSLPVLLVCFIINLFS